MAGTMLGDESGCPIPTAFVQTGKTIYARVFLHDGEDNGFVEYEAVIPNKVAIAPTDIPTPEQEGVISQLITLMEAAVEDAQKAAEEAEQAMINGVYVGEDGNFYIRK